MRDGARLAARLWLPKRLPAAALLEALPYRMDDLTASYTSEYERLCEEGDSRSRGSTCEAPEPRTESQPTSSAARAG
jgi:predicted acyl esterase